ncbi:MAG: HU family DNA-binding protein [Planctomycetes bacterium]|nr:HU family DNA-binding protein [Planctomycetota bacterium]
MRKAHGGLAALAGAIVLTLSWTGPARSQRPVVLDPLPKDIAKRAEVDEADVAKVLNALGPAVARQIAAGREVAVPGLGTFRVVRIPENKDLVGGRPATVPPRNYVEFLPDEGVVQASNSPDAKPGVTVPPFQYTPLPGQTPSQKVPSGRTPSTRIR